MNYDERQDEVLLAVRWQTQSVTCNSSLSSHSLIEWMLDQEAQLSICVQKTDTIYDCYPERMGGTLGRKRVEDLFACRHPD